MKKVFLALAAVVALAACSKEETLVQQAPEAIGFDTFVNNATRSVVDPSFTNDKLFTDFQCYGFVENVPLFNSENNGVLVSKSIDNTELASAWKYAGTQYWIPGADYNFSAVAPATDGNWTKTDATASGTKLAFVNNGELDLLYAQSVTIEGKDSGNDEVEFNFRHVLSKVRFSFLNNYSANNTVLKVRDIKIKNGLAKANVTLDGTTTTWADWNTGLVLNFGDANTTNDITTAQTFAYEVEVESHYERLLIPYNYDGNDDDKLKVEFTYDIVVSGTVVATFTETPEVVVNLEPGHAYDFKATIEPGEPIEFTATVSGWDESNLNQTM